MNIRDAVEDRTVSRLRGRAQSESPSESGDLGTLELVVTHDPHPLALEGMVLKHAEVLAAIAEGTIQPGTRLAAKDGSAQFIVTTDHQLHQFQLRTKWHVPVLVEGALE